MTSTVALLTLALLQQHPVPQDPPPQDVIELQKGGRLEGRIVEETKDYIQIRLGPDTVVGFERSKIVRVTRGAPAVEAPPAKKAALPARDEWFALHDAGGWIVGRLHSTVTADADGNTRLGEEWEFAGKSDTTAITLLEVVDAELKPISCFYHERRMRKADGRMLKERLVRGTVDGDRFIVERQTPLDRVRNVYSFDPQLGFPLATMEAIRRRARQPLDVTRTVFDPATEEFAQRSFSSGRRRRVEWRQEVMDIHEVSHVRGRSRNAEWLDAACRTLRREINGSSLVAVPANSATIENYLMASEPVFPAAVAIEKQSKFALWLPDPSWKLLEVDEPGQVTASQAIEAATATMLSFDQLDSGLLLDSVADAVARWISIAKERVEIEKREHVGIRDRDAVCLRARYTDRRSGRPQAYRCEVYVFAVDNRYMALCFDAPKREFERLRPDFDSMLRSVELYPKSLEGLSAGLASAAGTRSRRQD